MMLALILIGILMMVFMQRLDKLVAYAEQARFQVTLNNLRQGLNHRFVEGLISRDSEVIAALDHANPFAIAAQAPSSGYLGVLISPSPAELRPGNWYFDNDTKYLVYLIDTAQEFDSALGKPWRVRLETRLIYEDKNSDGRYSAGEQLSGIQLRPADRVSWNHKVLY